VLYAEDRHRILHEIDQAILAAQSPEQIATETLNRMHRLLPTQPTAVSPRAQEQTIGAPDVELAAPDAPSAEHVDEVTQVAMSLASALQAAELYSAAQQELADRDVVERARREGELLLRQEIDDLAWRNGELDAFAHTVAHDLKAPLTLLLGYTSLIEAGELGDDPGLLGKCIKAIGRSAHKMNSIVDELLLLASVRGPGDIECGPVDMAPILSDVLWRFSDLIQRRQATITLPEDWPMAVGYGPWVEEVWSNYLSNALKYGGCPPLITLGTSVDEGNSKDDGPSLIRFWVRDNGPGLSMAQQDQLFRPFERMDPLRADGHGLGLSIVQRIMARLGGEAGVESSGKLGEGSTFHFTLPGLC
jgi:signal transduction histidine kinase